MTGCGLLLPPPAPASVTASVFHAVFGCLTERPPVTAFFDFDLEETRQLSRRQENVGELIPPEALRCFESSGGQKNRGGNVGAREQRFGLKKVVGVAIVERHDDGAPRDSAVSDRPNEIPKRDGPA